jgi:menaquinone-specific isochorismate synthase
MEEGHAQVALIESEVALSPAFGPGEVPAFLDSGCLLGIGPGEAWVGWGRMRASRRPQPGAVQFYASDFYTCEPRPWRTYEHAARLPLAHIIEALGAFDERARLGIAFHEPDFERFANAFAKVRQAISRGDIHKAVPVTFATATAPMTHAMRAHCIRRALSQTHGLAPYALLERDAGIVGATPETLFRFDHGIPVLHTMALAGTRASADERDAPLLADTKECHEHALVAHGLRDKLAALGELEISRPHPWSIGPITHLRSDISLRLSRPALEPGALFEDMVGRLHPTPALGVAPVTADWRTLLRSLDEPVERARFGAPFGVLDPRGRSRALVAIRNLQWNAHGQILVGSGVGIVGASQLDREWREMALKRRSVHDLLGL